MGRIVTENAEPPVEERQASPPVKARRALLKAPSDHVKRGRLTLLFHPELSERKDRRPPCPCSRPIICLNTNFMFSSFVLAF